MVGRPPGAENKNKRFKAALVRYVDRNPDCLDRIVGKLMKQAEEGEISAMREMIDRLDGRPPQAIVGDDEHPALTVTWQPPSSS
jgi:hypothetical protein